MSVNSCKLLSLDIGIVHDYLLFLSLSPFLEQVRKCRKFPCDRLAYPCFFFRINETSPLQQ